MKDKVEIKFSSELLEVMIKAGAEVINNKEKSITLDSVLCRVMEKYLSDDSSILDEEFKKIVDSVIVSSHSRLLNTIKKIAEKSSISNRIDPVLESSIDEDNIPSSSELNSVLDRAKKQVELFDMGSEVTTSVFILSALWEDNNKIVKQLISKGLDKDTLLTNLKWFNDSVESVVGSLDHTETTSKLEAKFIEEDIPAPGSGFDWNKFKDSFGSDLDELMKKVGEIKNNKENNNNSNSNSDDEDFQKAGQIGSVRTKKIDPNSPTPFLDEFAFDMTKAAKEGKYDPVVGREREVGSLIEILACRKKNNAILLGEPGCGKTSVVEALVDKIAKKEVPYVLQNKRIVSLDLNALVAGAIYRGEYEKRLQGIIKEVVETKGIIVFIDEVHNLIGNGSSSGQGDGANILKPYLARGEFQIIGATTKTEYRIIEKDGALKRRFQNVVIEDPNIKETVDILRTVCDRYSNYHGVKYNDSVLDVCARWSDKYISDRHQPDKSIDIMDMAGSLCKLRKPHDIKAEEDIQKKIEQAIQNKIQAVENEEFDLAGKYREEEISLKKELEDFKQGILDSEKDKDSWPEVTLDDVADVISKITNIPVDKIKSTDTAKITELKSSLLTNIIGQDHAVEQVVKTLQLGVLGIRDPKRPLCSFLLCGPSGVGKTHLAKLLAKYYFGNENAIVRINMGEMDEHSKARLLGSQPGTIGYDEPTPFDDLATRPASVVLLDEVEKADAKIFDVILNAIGEEGYITLNNGKDISFRQSIVILTSNIGTKELQIKGDGLGFSKETGDAKKKSDEHTVMKAIKKFFRPEFLNRLTGIAVFNELGKDDMMKIFDLELLKMNERTKDSGYVINVSDKVKTEIIDSVDTKFGARDLTRKIMELVSNNVCEEMIKVGSKVKKNIFVDLGKDKQIKIKFKD